MSALYACMLICMWQFFICMQLEIQDYNLLS